MLKTAVSRSCGAHGLAIAALGVLISVPAVKGGLRGQPWIRLQRSCRTIRPQTLVGTSKHARQARCVPLPL